MATHPKFPKIQKSIHSEIHWTGTLAFIVILDLSIGLSVTLDWKIGLFAILDLSIGRIGADLYDTAAATQSSVGTWKTLTTPLGGNYFV